MLSSQGIFVACDGFLYKDCWVGVLSNPGNTIARVVQHHSAMSREVIRASLYGRGYRVITFS